jgi:hypothetical protein
VIQMLHGNRVVVLALLAMAMSTSCAAQRGTASAPGVDAGSCKAKRTLPIPEEICGTL